MKKLVFALVTGVFASIAGASTVSWWYNGDVVNANGDAATGDAWILCLGSGTDTSSIYVDDTGAIQYGSGISIATSTDVDGGALNSPASSVTSAANYVLVMSDTASQTYGMTPYQNVTPSSAEAYVTQDVDFGDIDNWPEFTTSTAWKGGSGGGGVPEPTSGLLLALGGAMLALRRRRA